MTLLEQWWAVYNDMDGKHTRHDWHGVRDACVDLEGIEIRMRERGIPVPQPKYRGSKASDDPAGDSPLR
jgi:hypothetical protein